MPAKGWLLAVTLSLELKAIALHLGYIQVCAMGVSNFRDRYMIIRLWRQFASHPYNLARKRFSCHPLKVGEALHPNSWKKWIRNTVPVTDCIVLSIRIDQVVSRIDSPTSGVWRKLVFWVRINSFQLEFSFDNLNQSLAWSSTSQPLCYYDITGILNG